MNAKILEHLQGRPIAPIVNASKEKGDLRALKLICIIDYNLEISGLYPELKTVPKLIGQLLSLHSFGSFKYYKYSLSKLLFDEKILKCKYCELIGHYSNIVEHMVISHNIHMPTAQCMWCENFDVAKHLSDGTFYQCYQEYVGKFSNIIYFPVITKVHNMLEKLATKLNVKVVRRENFKNDHSVKEFEIIPQDQTEEIDHHIFVLRPRKHACKDRDDNALEKLYQNAMNHFYADASERFSFQPYDDISPRPPRPKRPCNSETQPDVLNSTETHPDQSSMAQTPVEPNQFVQPNQFIQPNQFDQPNQTVHSTQPMAVFQPMPPPPRDFAFMSLISSVLANINDNQLKHQAKLEIQKIAFEYSAQDVIKQINNHESLKS